MHRLTKYIVPIFGAIIAMSLWSCVADSSDCPEEFVVPEGMEKLTIRIPNFNGGAADFNTRAFNESEEGYMSNLYVIAIKYAEVDGDILPESQRKLYTFALNPLGINFLPGEKDSNGEKTYHTFNLALYPGRYKFALIANADLYLWRTQKISDFTQEKELQNIILYFSEDTPLAPLHLPMVCLPYNIQFTDAEHTNKTLVTEVDKDNYLVPITENNSTVVYADMSFLCAKVRYTILFDKTPNGISKAFGNSWIRFNVDDQQRPRAVNLRSYTRLHLEPEISTDKPNVSGEILLSSKSSASGSVDGHSGATSQGKPAYWNISINRFKWPSEGADYPQRPKSELEPWTGTTDEWITKEQKAWQGVVYLPENLLTDAEQKTVLEFPYYTKANSDDDTPEIPSENPKKIYLFGNTKEHSYEYEGDKNEYSSFEGQFLLDRNYMYDVVAKVVNPNDDEMDVQVFVSVIPWHEEDQILDIDDIRHQGASSDETQD